MELQCNGSQKEIFNTKQKDPFIVTLCNWEIDNNKSFDECVSTTSLLQSDRTSLEDVVSLDTCVALKSCSSGEACKLEFKILNQQRIARIALASEGSVLEFFKQSGEYATTIFAECIDEFQDHSVYFAETVIDPPSKEASIKFTRTKNKGETMWIYGIKLICSESILDNSKNIFDLDVINNLLSNTNQPNCNKIKMSRKVLESYNSIENNLFEGDINKYLQKIATINCKAHNNPDNYKTNENSQQCLNDIQGIESNNDSLSKDYFNLKTYIDNQFSSLEKRLIGKIEHMNIKINQKLDNILKCLEHVNSK